MSQSPLANVYLFKTMSADELKMIGEIAKTQSFQKGDSVFLRGEPAMAMFLIQHGSVRIQQTSKSGDNVDVATLGTGSHFGEMPFVDNEVRSATAVAAEQSEMLVIPYDQLSFLLGKNTNVAVKFYRELAKFMCGRLRATTSDLGFAREKNLSHF